jgi:hypothetical protein
MLHYIVNDIGRVECVVAIEQSECPKDSGEPPMKSRYLRSREFVMNVYEFSIHIIPLLTVRSGNGPRF